MQPPSGCASVENHSRAELLDQVLDEVLPRYGEAWSGSVGDPPDPDRAACSPTTEWHHASLVGTITS